MSSKHQRTTKTGLTEALIAYAIFCGLSLVSRLIPVVFFLVIISGIAFPLIWGWATREWTTMGFTRRGSGPALAWGFGAGLLGVVYIGLSAGSDPFPEPPLLALQLAGGIPVAALLLSPFQEFFFRGWLQPRVEAGVGRWPGLLATAAGFAVWHLLPPFEGSSTTTIDMSSVGSILTSLAMGLLFGYVFQRTRNILAPWLAHLLWIIALLVVGAMTIVRYSPA